MLPLSDNSRSMIASYMLFFRGPFAFPVDGETNSVSNSLFALVFYRDVSLIEIPDLTKT